MTLTERLRGRLSELVKGRARARRGTEQDVDPDDHQALKRPPDGEFVGRASGGDGDPVEEETK